MKSKLMAVTVRFILLKLKTNAAPGSPAVPLWRYPRALFEESFWAVELLLAVKPVEEATFLEPPVVPAQLSLEVVLDNVPRELAVPLFVTDQPVGRLVDPLALPRELKF
jgi:hypothetical protein